MYAIRRWSTRNAGLLEGIYRVCATAFHALEPVWARIGLRHLEGPMVVIESRVKGVLFDCKMCGRCVLSETGMTCPMNCPKGLRNGPCGGVRGDGHCEVRPERACVWVEAWSGAARMRDGRSIRHLQPPQDHSISGTSAWLRLSAERLAGVAAGKGAGPP